MHTGPGQVNPDELTSQIGWQLLSCNPSFGMVTVLWSPVGTQQEWPWRRVGLGMLSYNPAHSWYFRQDLSAEFRASLHDYNLIFILFWQVCLVLYFHYKRVEMGILLWCCLLVINDEHSYFWFRLLDNHMLPYKRKSGQRNRRPQTTNTICDPTSQNQSLWHLPSRSEILQNERIIWHWSLAVAQTVVAAPFVRS